MNQTIYFQKAVWEHFSKEEKKSELVNKLLTSYYNTSKLPEALLVDKKNISTNRPAIRVTEAPNYRECKNGHSIPEGRTRCLQKGCKY